MAYSTYNQYGFSPYNNYVQPMVQPLMQQQYQQPYQPAQSQYYTQQPIQQTLQGQIVDSIEAVKAKDVDLNGTPLFYPNVNGNEIYKKQLMSDGTSKVSTYRIVEDASDEAGVKGDICDRDYITVDKLNNSLSDFKSDLISEIKDIFK